MENKFLITTILFINFGYLSAQLEEIKNIDRLYDKKTENIKMENKRPKKYLPLLSELNTQRISEYNKVLKTYYVKDSTEFIHHQNEFIKKIKKFENRG